MSSLLLQLFFFFFLITLNLERQLTFVYVATIYLELNPSVIHWQLKQISLYCMFSLWVLSSFIQVLYLKFVWEQVAP